MLFRLTFLFILLAHFVGGQSISFMETDLESAIQMAKRQNKNIFIDTYASYCKPCKKMDVEFRDTQLATYFNENFINIKINVERTNAEAYKSAYDIVFLPTLLFLNPEGHLRMSIDRLIMADDLLKMGQHINGDHLASTTTKPTIKPNPTPRQNTTPVVTKAEPKPLPQKEPTRQTQPSDIAADGEGKILYVMGQDSDNLPPEILREEAYFRMQLMDGSHKEAAKKYLDSQEDWSSEDNMRFIHDFLNDARSKEFTFLIENRAAFENTLSKEVIAQSINILVNKELERAYPRPDEQRVKQLLSHAGTANPALEASVYALNSIYASGNMGSFLAKGKEIVFNDEVTDADLLYKYSIVKSQKDNSKKSLKKCLQLAERSTSLDSNNSIYQYNAAQIALLLKNKKKALTYVQAADRLNENEAQQKLIDKILRLIEAL